ncbi:type I-E CRISPR-associated protein Cse2/CasB [Streptomyces sp. NBC_00249]|uniref:type I-E CRISPR-associated protein Cse2/CasB n=1 Tax=Streptomyces sp. NBC_00249 TaxID=2975690 RepID=UPI00224D3374|nr:type I-E CRISPR-associated protein Cse2/CasB [Streptomyces sp. NBC_00249]MCX5199259.1 type I-E CRISPR-associated protein Cse2/CasB [Streptomyces sp. NBC_00249]
MSTQTEFPSDDPDVPHTSKGLVDRGRRERAWEEQEPGERLTAWLASLVRDREYGQLAELRRPRVRTNTRIRAGWLDPDRREVFEEVAFLFAVYHRGAVRPSYGFGSLGAAARRIGGGAGRGPNDPGASRLIDRIVSSRRIPWRHLQHTVARLRSCDQAPPDWTRLADDLGRWNDRKAAVADGWAVDFHEPARTGDSAGKRDTTADTTEKGTTT